MFSDLCYFCRSDHTLSGECVCESCFERMPFIREPYCVICGLPFLNQNDSSHKCGDCIKEKRHYNRARSVFVYDDIIRQKIIEYKFMRNTTLARAFSEQMLHYIEYELNNEYDTIIPVPLHKKRLKERCFNQALLLVDGANKRNQITVDKYSLKRIKYTTPQVMLKGRARISNVRGAFKIENDYNIKSKRILVVDDIFTTGATVDECAKILKSAGAAAVDVLTLAKSVMM